jgi:hypothetical protein
MWFSVQLATSPPLFVILSFFSLKPKNHLKQPFLNYFSELPDSNLSFSQSLHANTTTGHDRLLPHPFPNTILTQT